MNLIIDVGNSFVKLAIFKGDELLFKKVVELNVLVKHIDILRREYTAIGNAIIASVGKLKQKDLVYIKAYFNVVVLHADTKLPFNNSYKTPSTLGVDRMALVAAAVKQFKNEDVLIIDAGTCITYDFINAKNNYLGGAISPGIDMRYKSLNNLTANLPLLEKELPEGIIGTTTKDSMHSGVINGVVYEIDGVIAEYQRKYSHLTVILTGGDGNFLSKQLKSTIFANSNFLLEGLNYILQFNLD
ncbi:type III pantothenate kinase [Flavobacteriaceae bacterium XHP0103]|uniref:type III pantothenate kinase n=1 Tax=Marixanthotalea marina TaxID=2844359 RepID=UPI002989E3E2|nr:type III pantothenate kinase [Marixanthotalea marina]MBU3821041.1 type III pantothenate kinase [Marixanthotalea marina]